LFYSDRLMPLADRYPNVAAYLDRLKQRASYARALQEAEPYFRLFPQE
jgi:glutathione S-transferase